MARYQLPGLTAWLAALVLLGTTPTQAAAQAPREGPPSASVVFQERAWSASARPRLPARSDSGYQSRTRGSAARTIATHAAVGTGAGLLIGLVLSGATVGDDRASVVLTWTAVGAAAGVVSGVVTWLAGGRR